MSLEQIVELGRQTLETALMMGAPILAAATIVSVVISIVQVTTSMNDITFTTVPRLGAVFLTTFLLMPWILRKLVAFTAVLFSDFHPFVR
jgi:flagellar biosynthetic protein FliQ